MKRIVFMLLAFALLVLTLSFTVINAQEITLNYYIGSIQMPLALALVLAFALGALFAVLAMSRVLMKQHLQLSKAKRNLKHSEKEIANLRTIPIKEPH